MLTKLLVLTTLLVPASGAPRAAATSAHASPAVAPAVSALFFPGLFLQNDAAGKVVTAETVVAEVQKFYRNTTNLTAKFRQTTVQKAFGRKETSDGKVFIKKP